MISPGQEGAPRHGRPASCLDCGPDNPLARYLAFDALADLVNSGQLSLLGAKAVWYELACPAPQGPLLESPESDD